MVVITDGRTGAAWLSSARVVNISRPREVILDEEKSAHNGGTPIRSCYNECMGNTVGSPPTLHRSDPVTPEAKAEMV